MTYPDGKSERVLYTPEIPENPQMLSLLTPFQNKGKAQLDVKIGTLNGRLEGTAAKSVSYRPIWVTGAGGTNRAHRR